jgi:hypothetical protein
MLDSLKREGAVFTTVARAQVIIFLNGFKNKVLESWFRTRGVLLDAPARIQPTVPCITAYF